MKSAVHATLAATLAERHPEAAARRLEDASPDELAPLLARWSPAVATPVLARLTPDTASRALERLEAAAAGRLVVRLDPNRAAALLSRLEPEACTAILEGVDSTAASGLRSLMDYPSDSAGGMMDPRVMTFRPDASVREVIRKLRTLRRRRVQDVFLVDEDARLVGSVPLQRLILAERGERLDALVRSAPASVQATSPLTAVLEELREKRSDSLPVVDFEGRVVGVLRQDELIRTAERGLAEGLVKMTGASGEERALSSPLFAVRKRLPWLEVNLLTAFLAAAVVGLFESTIAKFTALAVLLPVVAGQSGNTGAQSLAVTMRGLALREIQTRHWLRVTAKEATVGALNGIAVALTTSVAVWFWSRSPGLAFVIGVSMILSMAAASLAGATIPMVLAKLRQDPAQSSSIILTTVTDVVGFLSFLGIATMLSAWL